MQFNWLSPRDNALLLIALSMIYIAWQMMKQFQQRSPNAASSLGGPLHYEGDLDASGRYTGAGKLRAPNGDEYEGEFEAGQFSGRGLYRFARGGSYEGPFLSGQFSGKGGVEKYADGSIYRGEFQDGKRHGLGVMTYFAAKPLERHATFVGRWEQGAKLEGTYTYADESKFEGSFAAGKRHGLGHVVDKTGVRKRGEWKEGVLKGAFVQLSAEDSIAADDSQAVKATNAALAQALASSSQSFASATIDKSLTIGASDSLPASTSAARQSPENEPFVVVGKDGTLGDSSTDASVAVAQQSSPQLKAAAGANS